LTAGIVHGKFYNSQAILKLKRLTFNKEGEYGRKEKEKEVS